MNNFIAYLDDNLNLYGFTMLKTTFNKAVIFKTYNKFTKCIYINIHKNTIEVKIDKVFDLKGVYPDGIERLLISKNIFNNIDDTFNYLQKNIAI